MSYPLNSAVAAVMTSPVTQAHQWLAGREFPPELPLLDVAQAVPGYPPAPELTAHLAERIGAPEIARYTGNHGIPELRSALAEHMSAAYRGAIRPEQVTITAGCNQAFCTVTSALAGPDDEIILPLPYYFNHRMWLELQGIRPVYLPFDDNPLPDPERAARLITPRTRALVLVTPNNPTGAIYAPALIEAFFELAQRHGIALIIDETYKDFRADATPAHELFQRSDWADTFIQLYSFSKVFSLTGYRVGSIICTAALTEQIAKIVDCVTICPPRIGQEAALFGLDRLTDWVADKRRLMQQRLAALRAIFDTPGLDYELVSSGAYFAYVRHPFPDETSQQVAWRLFDRHHVLCLPGSTFGPEQERYLRFAFANLDAAEFPALIERLKASQQANNGVHHE